MGNKKKKIVLYLLPAIVLLAGGLFFLNLHLTKRMERYLQKELILRTTTATDGFYRLSFDTLSISLFRGELMIRGIRLSPDSGIFRKWTDLDSLPKTYINAHIGLIDFKGVNLTWRWSYKKLHFNSFEIKSPDIEITNSYSSSRTEKDIKYAETKTLYEIISPYINELSVKTLNLENASVSLLAENPEASIIYGLQDVSFHAYDFQLNKNSSQSGKLLYCDNFDFITNKPQTLLINNDFTLKTDSIRLSTQDSIIYIKNISLLPQKKLWEENNRKPANYIDALIKTVDIQGILFRREQGLNYLVARSFDIISSDIKVFNLQSTHTTDTVTQIDADSLGRSLSLYDLISPVLHSVSIQSIGIAQTKLQYAISIKNTVDTYKLADFYFQARDFFVDSLSEEKHGLWYSQSFAFEANGIEGLMPAHNHRFSVQRMALNTATGDFKIEKIRLRPLSIHTRNDYMIGSIDSVSIRGLQYDKGIRSEVLQIDHPDIQYTIAPPFGKKNTDRETDTNRQVDVRGILNPFLQYLAVKRMNLNGAYITLNDNGSTLPATYQLKNFNFYATNIQVDETTGKDSIFFFDYDNIGFSFSHFDNYLPGKEYRLSIRKGQFSTMKGILQLLDIQLTPQENARGVFPDPYIRVTTPQIYADGFRQLPKNPIKNLKMTSFRVDSPNILIRKSDSSFYQIALKELAINRVAWDSTWLQLGSVSLRNPVAILFPNHHQDVVYKKTVPSLSGDLYKTLGSISDQITLGKLTITDANINYTYYQKGDSLQEQKMDTTNLSIDGLAINNIKRNFQLDDIHFSTRNLAIPLDQGFYILKIGNINLNKANLSVDQLHLMSPYPKMEFAYRQPKHKDWFDVRVDNLSLKEIDMPSYFQDKIIRIKDVLVSDVVLQNFKNQKIIVPQRIIPMIYSGLQKAPVKLDFTRVSVNNFSVIYEELARKGKEPGKLFFTNMNGTFSGFTNIVSTPNQYIRLEANGKIMGKGSFNATWQLPVDSLNDQFLLNAQLGSFNLTTLNQLITPLTSMEVQSGQVQSMVFNTVASSKKAHVDMLFLYNGLKATVLKEKDGELTDNKLLSRLANLVLKHNNPDLPKNDHNKPRHSSVTIERDPYHSTFNYLWQILRPALVESVGISKKKQDTAKSMMTFITKVKNFFRHKQHEIPEVPEKEEDKEPFLLNFETQNNE